MDGDVNALSRFFSQFTIYVLGNGILLGGILVVLFYEDWRAGLALTMFTLTALSALIRLRFYAIPYWAALRQASAEFFGFLSEQLAGTEDIRANGAASYVMHRFYKLLQRWLPIYQKARLAGTILWGTTVGLFTVGNAIALAVGAYLWSQKAITIGTVFLIFYYTDLLRQPIEQIREELENLQQVEASISRIRELFKIQSKLSPGGETVLPVGALSVSFENVWFSYEEPEGKKQESKLSISSSQLHLGQTHPKSKIQVARWRAQTLDPNSKIKSEWVLQNISFYLPPGQVLGLLGRTGSGKTTLVRLLLRLYEPQVGSVRLGGTATDQTPLRDIPQRVGLVTQDVQLFQTTVRNNLTFFNPKISDEQILNTLELLGLSLWLHSLPQGLDTPLGSNSGGLSAGQAQLLAFARIFLKHPGLVILDEASSRLDPTTENLIERAMDRLLQGRTAIIIAHRLATVQRADQILILENGRSIEYGRRENLANNPDSRFARLLKTGLTDVLA